MARKTRTWVSNPITSRRRTVGERGMIRPKQLTGSRGDHQELNCLPDGTQKPESGLRTVPGDVVSNSVSVRDRLLAKIDDPLHSALTPGCRFTKRFSSSNHRSSVTGRLGESIPSWIKTSNFRLTVSF